VIIAGKVSWLETRFRSWLGSIWSKYSIW